MQPISAGPALDAVNECEYDQQDRRADRDDVCQMAGFKVNLYFHSCYLLVSIYASAQLLGRKRINPGSGDRRHPGEFRRTGGPGSTRKAHRANLKA